MKHMIKLLPLLEPHLASRAIKQLNIQSSTAVLNLADATKLNSILMWPHLLPCMAISTAAQKWV